jgi:hypothetical protein
MRTAAYLMKRIWSQESAKGEQMIPRADFTDRLTVGKYFEEWKG